MSSSEQGIDTFGVVICAHSEERLPLLREAIRSVQEQQHPPQQLVVVIDYNPILMVKLKYEFPGLTITPNLNNKGLSGARNTGVRQCTSALIAFLDDDATAEPDWAARMVSCYADQSVMGVGGRAVPVWPSARPGWFPPEFDWVVGCTYRGMAEHPVAVRNLLGCNMSFRRSIFERVGLFGEGIGRQNDNAAGCEETEFCIRANSVFPHSKIIYDPAIVVRHTVSIERATWRYFQKRCLAEGHSKALVAGKLGSKRALSDERKHLFHVLPVGLARAIGHAVTNFETNGLLRAGAIMLGTGMVGGTYLAGRLSRRHGDGDDSSSAFAPIQVLQIDRDLDLPRIAGRDATSGLAWGGAFCAVWEGGRLCRILELPLYGEDIPPSRLDELLGPRQFAPSVTPVVQGPDYSDPVRVVVATKDRPDSLRRCLDSLLKQSYQHFEVVVVDNAPSSAATRALLEAQYIATGRVAYIREDRPGLGHAHNCGLVGNSAEIVAFTDDDVLVQHSWLDALVRNFKSSPQVGCVTGMILPAELETRAQYWTERHGGFGKGLTRRVFDLEENRSGSGLYPFAAGMLGSGANMAFSRTALLSIGGFDGALGAGTLAKGGDDLAAFVAVIRAGFQLVYEPQAVVWHHHRRTEEGMRRQAYGYGVGLGAYLAKCLLEEPALTLAFARAFPEAVRHILSSRSLKNARLPQDYPTAWRWSERAGMMMGLPAYLRSRAALAHYKRAKAPSMTPNEQGAS